MAANQRHFASGGQASASRRAPPGGILLARPVRIAWSRRLAPGSTPVRKPHMSTRLALTPWAPRAGQISIEAEDPPPQPRPVERLQCAPVPPAPAAPAAAAAAAGEHAERAASEPGACGGGCLAGRHVSAGDERCSAGAGGSARGAGHGAGPEAGGLALTWRAPPGCARCEVWARRAPAGGPDGLLGIGAGPGFLAEAAPSGGAAPAASAGSDAPAAKPQLRMQHAGWTWLGTAHAPRYWVAAVADPSRSGAAGAELAVQAYDSVGRALPLESCLRASVSSGSLPAGLQFGQ